MPAPERVAPTTVDSEAQRLAAKAPSPRRVVLIINNMRGGGAERVVATLANYFHASLGWTVTILTLEEAPVQYELLPGIEVRALHGTGITAGIRSLLGVPLLAVELAWYLRRHHADAVMSFLVRANTILMLTRWLGNRQRIIISERCVTDAFYAGRGVRSRMMRRLISAFYPSADQIVAISNGVKAALVRLRVPGERVRVIYNPQNLEQIVFAAATPTPHPAPRPFTIVTAGRLTEEKDYPTLFRAFKRLCDDGLDARMVILGEGRDGPKLRALATTLDIDGRIDWRGWVASPHALMAECDVFVLTSPWEGFGNVIVEAMACGLPVVCAAGESGPREILADGEYGILVPIGDSAAVAQAVRRLADDDGLRATLRARGRQRARDFDVAHIASQYVDVLTSDAHSPVADRRREAR